MLNIETGKRRQRDEGEPFTVRKTKIIIMGQRYGRRHDPVAAAGTTKKHKAILVVSTAEERPVR